MASEGTARAPRKTINPEFQVHRLNATGLARADEIAAAFDEILERCKEWLSDSRDGRELELVRVNLEQACQYTKKGMAKQHVNQQIPA